MHVMQRRIFDGQALRIIRQGDPAVAVVAILWPDGTIRGARDPDVVAAIQAALGDDEVEVPQPGQPSLRGPATSQEPYTVAWFILMQAALERRGLAFKGVGVARTPEAKA